MPRPGAGPGRGSVSEGLCDLAPRCRRSETPKMGTRNSTLLSGAHKFRNHRPTAAGPIASLGSRSPGEGNGPGHKPAEIRGVYLALRLRRPCLHAGRGNHEFYRVNKRAQAILGSRRLFFYFQLNAAPNNRVEQNRRPALRMRSYRDSPNTRSACVSPFPAAVAHPNR
jgi:hypothetical protein